MTEYCDRGSLRQALDQGVFIDGEVREGGGLRIWDGPLHAREGAAGNGGGEECKEQRNAPLTRSRGVPL